MQVGGVPETLAIATVTLRAVAKIELPACGCGLRVARPWILQTSRGSWSFAQPGRRAIVVSGLRTVLGFLGVDNEGRGENGRERHHP